MIRKLRAKFIVINMALVTLMLVLMLGTVIRLTSDNIRDTNESMMRAMAMAPRQHRRPDITDKDVRLPFFVIRVDKNGEITERSGGYYDLSDEEMISSLISTVQASGLPGGVISEYSLRYLREETPMGTSFVFADISSEQAAIRGLVRTCLFIGLLGFAVFFIISLLLARWATRPVETAFTQQKQFISDASHELKTPLTVILTNTEMLSSPDYSDVQKSTLIGNIGSMAEQMRGLVESLLSLSRLDSGTVSSEKTGLDFSSLTEEAVLPFEPLFFESGHTLSCSIESGISLKGDKARLLQVIGILLDNAQKYSLPSSEVFLTLKRQQRSCLLSVSGPGKELSKQQLKDIFKRFYRVDKARSMNHSYGLGLSIADAIVADHKGKIWAESENGMNTFFIQLPCA